MKKKTFTHQFEINEYGCPYSENTGSGEIDIYKRGNSISISGNKEGLLTLAKKIIETAEAEIEEYHKHLDEIEVPSLTINPDRTEIDIEKRKDV
jgi:hypothetical protein